MAAVAVPYDGLPRSSEWMAQYVLCIALWVNGRCNVAKLTRNIVDVERLMLVLAMWCVKGSQSVPAAPLLYYILWIRKGFLIFHPLVFNITALDRLGSRLIDAAAPTASRNNITSKLILQRIVSLAEWCGGKLNEEFHTGFSSSILILPNINLDPTTRFHALPIYSWHSIMHFPMPWLSKRNQVNIFFLWCSSVASLHLI